MKIGVIGGGSVGLLVSSFLCEKHDVTIYVRSKEQKIALNSCGLYFSDFVDPLSVRALLLEEIEEADCYIICVKQHHIAQVLPIINQLHRQTPLLFLQNGMGHMKLLKEIDHPVFLGVVEHGALRKNNHHVYHTGKGSIKLAVYQGKHQLLIDMVHQLHLPEFPIETVEEWERLLAEKLMINAVINPLTALFNIPNGQILTNPYICYLAKKLCKEAASVLKLDDDIQWERIQRIAYQTQENISSMLTDIREGKQTENEAISGFLIQESQESIPYTSFVYHGVKALALKKDFMST